MFRKPALEARRNGWIGEVVLARPPGFSLYCAIATAFVLAFGVVLINGTYSERSEIRGKIVGAEGSRTSVKLRFVATKEAAMALRVDDRIDVQFPELDRRAVGDWKGVVRSVGQVAEDAAEVGLMEVLVDSERVGGDGKGGVAEMRVGAAVRSQVLLGEVPVLRKLWRW